MSKLYVSKLCDDMLCVDKLCVSKLCVSKLCEDKLCVHKLCVDKLCVDKLCVCKFCDDKLCEDKLCGCVCRVVCGQVVCVCEQVVCVSKLREEWTTCFMPKVSTCFPVTSTPFFMLAVPYQHASNPFLGADQGGIEWGGRAPYVRHLEAISQAKKLWINTNQKAAKQTIGAKWTQLIPPASGRNRLSRKTCR